MLNFKYPDAFGRLSLPPGRKPTSERLTDASNQTTGDCSLSQEEEQSWLYYLAEISLRRIMNRILEGFYSRQEAWNANELPTMLVHYKAFSEELALW